MSLTGCFKMYKDNIFIYKNKVIIFLYFCIYSSPDKYVKYNYRLRIVAGFSSLIPLYISRVLHSYD